MIVLFQIRALAEPSSDSVWPMETKIMFVNNDVAGAAALAICESLILCLGDKKILAEKEIIGILEDAISAHLNAPVDDGMTKLHGDVAILIKSIIDGGNSVRRPHLKQGQSHSNGRLTANESRAEFFRRAAEQCLEEAELSQDETMKARIRSLANQWLKLAAAASLVDDS